jgi:hypothetical protein
VCSGLKAEMEFGEVKISVRVYGHLHTHTYILAQRQVDLGLFLRSKLADNVHRISCSVELLPAGQRA